MPLVANVPIKDTQDAYERIRAWFTRPQAELSSNADGQCFYRLPSTSPPNLFEQACAVGCLLPDKLYHPKMEGERFAVVLTGYPGVKEFFSDVDTAFLSAAQRSHDSSCSTNEFVDDLDGLARAYGLSTPSAEAA